MNKYVPVHQAFRTKAERTRASVTAEGRCSNKEREKQDGRSFKSASRHGERRNAGKPELYHGTREWTRIMKTSCRSSKDRPEEMTRTGTFIVSLIGALKLDRWPMNREAVNENMIGSVTLVFRCIGLLCPANAEVCSKVSFPLLNDRKHMLLRERLVPLFPSLSFLGLN